MDYKWTPEGKKVVDGLQFELEYAKRNNLASARVPRGMLEKGLNMLESQQERIAIMTEGGLWIPVEKRLPENAQNKGAFCPRYRVYTKWGETEGWYNPDKGCWYFLLWYLDEKVIDLEHGDNPKLAHEINGVKVVTHWMPLPEPPKEGG